MYSTTNHDLPSTGLSFLYKKPKITLILGIVKGVQFHQVTYLQTKIKETKVYFFGINIDHKTANAPEVRGYSLASHQITDFH